MQETLAAQAATRGLGLIPGETAVVLLSFEGPDQYARRGALGETIEGLGWALAMAGFDTTTMFVGDPDAPAEELRLAPAGGMLRLIRCSQKISRYYPGGPYEEEEARVYDYTQAVQAYVANLEVMATLGTGLQSGRPGLVVIAHEWQTSGALLAIDAELRRRGLRHHALLVWTMRDLLNIGRVDLGALARSVSVTTVSRYLKHELWKHGLDPITLPPGLAAERFAAATPRAREKAAGLVAGHLAIFVPNLPPAWQGTVYDAVRMLKAAGHAPLLMLSGDAGAPDVIAPDLRVGPVPRDGGARDALDVLVWATPPDEDTVRAMQGAATATLLLGDTDATATSPLQAMAAGAIVVTDAAMSDPLIPFENGVALETRGAAELVATLLELSRDPGRLTAMREIARATASGYAWSRTLPTLLVKLGFLASY